MIVDWFKQNTLSTITGVVFGTTILSASVAYIVQGDASMGSFRQAFFSGNMVFPSRFLVKSDNGHDFACDLTVSQDASCTSHGPMAMTLVRITIRRHAGDPSRVAVYGYGTQKTGVTWQELQKGVVLGPSNVANKALGPATVIAIEPSK